MQNWCFWNWQTVEIQQNQGKKNVFIPSRCKEANRGRDEEEEGGPSHYLRPPLLPFLPLFPPSPLLVCLMQPTVIPGQLSQVRAYFSHSSSPSSSTRRILWNLHLTDLEVLDRTSTWNRETEEASQRGAALRVVITLGYKGPNSLALRRGQRQTTTEPKFSCYFCPNICDN